MRKTNSMIFSNSDQDQIWPGDWMGNNAYPSKDNLFFMDDKQRLRYFSRNPGYLKRQSKIQSVIRYLRNLVKL